MNVLHQSIKYASLLEQVGVNQNYNKVMIYCQTMLS